MYVQGIDPSMIIPIALIVAIGIIIYKGVKIVPQADAWVIERLGKYHKTLDGGLHLIIPVLDSVRDKLTKQEQIEAMNMQMKAEREKRAIELTAIANKEAAIREAEGLKQKTVLEAEAIERMADAQKYEQIALAEGQKEAMDMINEAIAKNNSSAEYLLTKDRISAFNELAKSTSKDKVIVPYEALELVGSLSMVSEFFGKSKK